MVQLSNGGHSNVLYSLTKEMETLRPESHFLINKMPMGLVFFGVFFAADKVKCEQYLHVVL